MAVHDEPSTQTISAANESPAPPGLLWPDYSLFLKVGIPLLLIAFAIVHVRECWMSACVVDGQRTFLLFDDAMICMRYAYNFAHGAGLVWNPGEFVQGYTNLGWVLVMASVHLLPLSLNYTSFAVQLINLCIYLGLLIYTGKWLAARTNGALTFLGLTLIAFNAPLLFWSVGGFEVPLQALLFTAAVLPLIPNNDGSFAERSKWPWIPVMLGFAYFIRPDSIVMFGVVTAFFVIQRLLRPKDFAPGDTIKIVFGTAIGTAIMGAVLGFQRIYYGDWLPNTYYLKVAYGARELERGWKYFLCFLFQNNQIPILCGAQLCCLYGLLTNTLAWSGFTASIAAWIGYNMWVGGDAFALSRFYCPITPLLIVGTILVTHRILQKVGLEDFASITEKLDLPFNTQLRREVACASIFLTAAVLVAVIICRCETDLVPEIVNLRVANENSVYNVNDLRRIKIQPHEVVSVFWGGGAPYLMPEQTFNDPLGKCDKRIAHMQAKWGPPGHNKWDFDYLLNEIKPAVIITNQPLSQLRDSSKARSLNDKLDFSNIFELWFHKSFRAQYRPNMLISAYDSNRETYLSPEAAEGREPFLDAALVHKQFIVSPLPAQQTNSELK